jgi:predicted PurR-regulated permease PerM
VPYKFKPEESMRVNKRTVKILALILPAVLILLFIAMNWVRITAIIRMLLLSVIFAYILTPVSELLEKRMSRPAAIIVLFCSLAAVFGLFFAFFLPRFIKEVIVLLERVPVLIQHLRRIAAEVQKALLRIGIPDGIEKHMLDYYERIEDKAAGLMAGFIDGTVGAFALLPELFIVPVLGFYFLKDREYFADVLKNLIPKERRAGVMKIAGEIHRILHQFIRGEIFIAAIVALLSAAGYTIIGLPYSLVLGLIAGALEVIPYFGPWLGAIPAILMALLQGPSKAVWAAVVVIVIQQLENGIITPRILGGEVELHPVYVILSLWVGGIFFGIAGMFFAVPAVLILRVILKHVYLSIVASS